MNTTVEFFRKGAVVHTEQQDNPLNAPCDVEEAKRWQTDLNEKAKLHNADSWKASLDRDNEICEQYENDIAAQEFANDL